MAKRFGRAQLLHLCRFLCALRARGDGAGVRARGRESACDNENNSTQQELIQNNGLIPIYGIVERGRIHVIPLHMPNKISTRRDIFCSYALLMDVERLGK